MDNLTISRENALAAYDNADANGRELLEHLFGKELFVKDITERVKTFEDACNELSRMAEKGDETAADLLADYESNSDNILVKQTLAMMKLSIIAYALNEGWVPQFEKDEQRYYPWFVLYTQSEIDELSDDEKCRVVYRGNHNPNEYGGIGYDFAFSTASEAGVSPLVFKTRELAEYAARQFVKLYADFIFPEKA